ncbi:MAG: FeoB small GTPase domain-containing protein, partial [Melioribacteraceae bacterium]
MIKTEIPTLNLSNLVNGEKGVITKVLGHGAFRKRISEMGFVKGKTVTVIKNAPLQDPIEYEIMGSHVSLRRSEANMIEVVLHQGAEINEKLNYNGTFLPDINNETIERQLKTINVALVGNPNSGKTTLFNFATGKHERVGNYGGVTVDTKEAHFDQNGYRLNVTDLPGT